MDGRYGYPYIYRTTMSEPQQEAPPAAPAAEAAAAPAAQAAAAPAAAETETSPENEVGQMVQPEEMPLAIVVTGIPVAEQTATEDAIVEAFSEFGDITRLILQTDDGGTNQHAVLIYGTQESAEKAVSFSGKTLPLGDGATVEVSLASALSDSSADGSAMTAAQEKAATFLAGGMVLGGKGVASVKNFDEQHNISLRVQIAAEMAKAKALEFDEKHGVSRKASAAFTQAKDKAAEIDKQYDVSGRARAATQQAQAAASEGYKKAMENPNVAAGVAKASTMFKSMWAFGAKSAAAASAAAQETVEKAKEKAAAEQATKDEGGVKEATMEEAAPAPAPASTAAPAPASE